MKADFYSHARANLGFQFLREPCGDGTRRQPPGLRMPNPARRAAPKRQTDFGQLCCFTGTCFPAYNYNLMTGNEFGDFRAFFIDWQGFWKGWSRQMATPLQQSRVGRCLQVSKRF